MPNNCYVCIVLGVIVNNNCSISNGSDLITVIQPWHHLGFWWNVLVKPKVSLKIIIKDDPLVVGTPRSNTISLFFKKGYELSITLLEEPFETPDPLPEPLCKVSSPWQKAQYH